ncbi:MAG: cytidylate kinase-like family protein [Eubacterium sp.]|nr:cytidylate kinase-like family protein [Eubacterium sp.]
MYTITITRQFGSLGRPIAKRAAELLNINYYDRDIVESTAKELGQSVTEISNQEENAVSNPFYHMLYPLGNSITEKQDEIFRVQSKIIEKVSSTESCIIVGRCADYVLRNNKNVLNIFIYASYEQRLRYCVDYLKMDLTTAKKMIDKVDRARDRYHKRYAGYAPSDYRQRDLLINSGTYGIEGSARLIAASVQDRFLMNEEQLQAYEKEEKEKNQAQNAVVQAAEAEPEQK